MSQGPAYSSTQLPTTVSWGATANVEKRLNNQIDPLVADQVRLLEQHFTRLYLQFSDLINAVDELRTPDFDDPATPEKYNIAMANLRVLVHSTSSELSVIQERIFELSDRSRRPKSTYRFR